MCNMSFLSLRNLYIVIKSAKREQYMVGVWSRVADPEDALWRLRQLPPVPGIQTCEA